MKILVVTPFMWSGAGKTIVRLASDLRLLNHDVEVVSSGESKGFCDWPSYVQTLQSHHIPYHQIDFFDRNAEVFQQSVEQLKQVVRNFRPDVIHAHSGMAAFGASAAADVPIVATLHSWNPCRPEWMNAMDVWALNRCAHVVSVSFSYHDYLLSMGLRSEISQVIHFGVDWERIRELAAGAATNTLSDKKYFCFLGRLESRKRQLLLVESLSHLPEDWSLLLIGAEGEPGYAERVQRRAAELGVLKRLVWTGQVENPFPMVSKSRCFVSVSSDEGLGISALEAMALDVPVMAVPARGIVDFIRDGQTGLLVEPKPEAIAEKILFLDSNESIGRSLTARAGALVEREFSWQTTLQHYLTVFEEAFSSTETFGVSHDNGIVSNAEQAVIG